MAVEWSGLSPEILVRLQRDSRTTLGAQLETELREAIRGGRLQPGERLPSSRRMATELGISRGLVQTCYEQLEAEGYLTARPGSATRVAPAATVPAPTARAAISTVRPDISFTPGIPDLGSFPIRDWIWAWGEVSRLVSPASAGYQDPRGGVELRRVVAGYLSRVRGARAEAENVVICAGFTQGVTLALAVLAAAGARRIGVENPGHPDIGAIVTHAGLEPVAVPMDGNGIDVAALAASEADAVVLTPAHQTPTGVVLSPQRRHALVEWASAGGHVIIEDDYDAEFRYDRHPVGSLQGLAPHRVVSIGSVSKSLAPSLRLGWMVCPPELTEAIAAEKYVTDRGSPALDQLALARLMESGRFDRHLRRMRITYAARRTALDAALAAHAPSVPISGLAAGFHLLAMLPPGADEEKVIEAAAQRSIGLQGLRRYRLHGNGGPAGIVIGFGNLNEAAIRTGISTVADLLTGAER
jgi:GntR family transcriptional regulator / MocR family aminotransferase